MLPRLGLININTIIKGHHGGFDELEGGSKGAVIWWQIINNNKNRQGVYFCELGLLNEPPPVRT